MVDIAKCIGSVKDDAGNTILCDARLTCFRFTSKPNYYRQAYTTFEPRKGKDCRGYWSSVDEEESYHDE